MNIEKQTEEIYKNLELCLTEQLDDFKKWEFLLREDIQKKLSGNGEFLSISDDIWKMAETGLFPLEELLLELPISQWIVQVSILENNGFGQHWQTVAQHLSKIRSVDDIRYAYFDMKTENAKMRQIYFLKSNLEKMNFAEITQILSDFTTANLHYADFVYTEDAFAGQMELLPEECRASVWLREALFCEENAWSKKLEAIKQAAKEFPTLAEIVKYYAVLIGEERKKEQAASQNAQNELLQMVEMMKPQIFTMVENGMLQDALAVVKQLRGMVPNDLELVEMEKVLLEAMQ